MVLEKAKISLNDCLACRYCTISDNVSSSFFTYTLPLCQCVMLFLHTHAHACTHTLAHTHTHTHTLTRSGCVTSAESVLISQQSQEELYRITDENQKLQKVYT